MAPYGYILPTHLVGWPDDLTNSPFFGGQKGAAMITPAKNGKRAHFGNHMFVLYREKVLDACAGPHGGHETLQEYLKNSIDYQNHNAETYDRQKNLVFRPDGYAGDVKIQPVLSLHDPMNPIKRVGQIYHYFLIGKTALEDKTHFYIPLDELAEYLKSHLPSTAFTNASGALKEISNIDSAITPESNGVRYGGFLTFSMNYVFKGVAYPVDIDWHVCLTSTEALNVLGRVSNNSTAFTYGFKEEKIDGQSFFSTPQSEDGLARTVFAYGPHAVVLDSPIGTSGLIPIAQTVLAYMKSNERKDTSNAFLEQNNDPREPKYFVRLNQGEIYTWITEV